MSESVTITIDVSKLPNPRIDDGVIEAWLEEVLNEARSYFISHMSGGRSAPGAYPGNQTGQLAGSIEVTAGGREGELSANTAYAGYLTSGTKKMASRKMMADALDESLQASGGHADELAKAAKMNGG